MDRISKEKRSANMAQIPSKDTKPEMTVRRWLYSNGFRYRLHASNLPGKPDIVMKRRQIIILVNGCFWHGHKGCGLFKIPKTNTEWWEDKISRNKKRDMMNEKKLIEMGWTVLVIWECQVRDGSFESLLTQKLIKGDSDESK